MLSLKKFYIGCLVVLLAVSFAWLNNVRQNWDRNEGTIFNILYLIQPAWPIETILNKPIHEQVAFVDRITHDVEKDLPECLVRRWFSEDIVTASFGPTQTKVSKLLIPIRDTNKEERDIPVLCTRPANNNNAIDGTTTPLPLVLYFHYGGLMFGSAKAELLLIRYVSQITNSVVCSPDYRKAPEHAFPAAVNDAMDASRFLIQNGSARNTEDDQETNLLLDTLGVIIDPSKVATFGISAGGYLSGHVARHLAIKEGITVKLQVSIVPMVKPFAGTQSLRQLGKKDYWNEDWNTFAWNSYLATENKDDTEKLVNDWRVNLLVDPPRNTEEEEKVVERLVLPPVYLQLHQRCPLYDEGKLYAQKLQEQGNLLELVEYNAIHGTFAPPMSNGGPADGSFERAVMTLKTHLYSGDNDNATVL